MPAASSDSSVSAEPLQRLPRGRIAVSCPSEAMMKRIRVEPISSYLERRRKGPIYVAVVANGFVYLSGLPPFDPETGDLKPAPFERQAEIVLDQMKHCLEAAGRWRRWSSAMFIARPILRISPGSTRFMRATFRLNLRPAFFCMCRHGRGRSTSRSTAWRW
jgi:enamine deaminase RidA (YjgF/YER057c/UK114 family)